MAKYLVMTLGTGAEVENGLACSIKTHHPDRVIFLATPTSEKTIDRLRPLLPEFEERMEVRLVKAEDDVEKCAMDALACLSELAAEVASPREITADFTSGTKAMTAGLCIAAVSAGLQDLSYVTGDRDPATGRVITGTERVLTVRLGRLRAHEQKRALIQLFKRRHFAEGLTLAGELAGNYSLPDIKDEFTQWKSLFEAFHRWDLFDHQGAMRAMESLDKGFLRLYQLDLDPCKEMLGRILTKTRKKESETSVPEAPAIFPELLADLLANAQRRAAEGRYDDAVARLYRACEMAAQLALLEKGHNTACLEPSRLPPEALQSLGLAADAEGPVMIAMERAYLLLRALGDERAGRYLDNQRLRNLLTARNRSILAHGVSPVGSEVCEELRKEVVEICGSFVENLDRLMRLAVFPTIPSLI